MNNIIMLDEDDMSKTDSEIDLEIFDEDAIVYEPQTVVEHFNWNLAESESLDDIFMYNLENVNSISSSLSNSSTLIHETDNVSVGDFDPPNVVTPTKGNLSTASHSSVLLAATEELREKHQKLLNVGKKRKSLVEEDLSYFFESMQEITLDSPDESDQTAQITSSPAVKLRTRHDIHTKLRKEIVSVPSFQNQINIPAAERKKEVQAGVGQQRRNTGSDKQSRTSKRRSSRLSRSFTHSGVHEMALSEFLNEAVKDRKKEEASAFAERRRLQQIVHMSSGMQQDDKQFEEENQDETSTKIRDIKSSTSSESRNSSRYHLEFSNENDAKVLLASERVTKSSSLRIPRPMTTVDNELKDIDAVSGSTTSQLHEAFRRFQLSKEATGSNFEGESLVKEIDLVISELETQMGVCMKELEMDRALVDVKLIAEKNCLKEEEKKCEELKDAIIRMEEDYIARREKHQEAFEEEERVLEEMKDEIEETKRQIDRSPESMKETIEKELQEAMETLEQQTKKHEDAEFYMLETISNLDEEKEEKQKSLLQQKKKLDLKINARTNRIRILETQLEELKNKQKSENQRLNKERDSAIELLQEVSKGKKFQRQMNEQRRKATSYFPSSNEANYSPTSPFASSGQRRPSEQKLIHLDEFMNSISFNGPSEFDLTKLPDKSLESVQTATEHPSSNPFNDKRNLHLSIDSPSKPDGTATSSGFNIASNREILRRPNRSGESNRARSTDRRSAYSIDSIDSCTSDSTDFERLMEMRKLLAEAKAKKELLLINKSPLPNQLQSETLKHPVVDSISNADEVPSPSLESPPPVTLRPKSNSKRQARPSSRFLPVRSSDFDLREHIDACGHNILLCQDTVLTATSCSGFLSKKSGKLKLWKKRWFVFDRTNKHLIYYNDKRESKERGKIPFEAIEDVFFDHLKSQKSPNPSLTFCVKCYDRVHYFSAPSSEAMRIWMDVMVTGAEGYREYMKTLEH